MTETHPCDHQNTLFLQDIPEMPDKSVLEISKLMLETLSARLSQRSSEAKRTFGFEYEFLPHRVLHMRDMENLINFFHTHGFKDHGGWLERGLLGVTFEPGGQVEYQSPPLPSGHGPLFEETLARIAELNHDIEKKLGIRYIAVPYMEGRQKAPLLLTSPRYKKMHERFAACDRRGLEMMKGTAAIHLHVAVLKIQELPVLYRLLCEMSHMEMMRMSSDRRNIWDQTDPSRCGLPVCMEKCDTPLSLLYGLVGFAMNAVDLETRKPFRYTAENENPTDHFKRFLDHFTTIFTDVRLNMKGGTLELRTLDSKPMDEFRKSWTTFTAMIEARMSMGR